MQRRQHFKPTNLSWERLVLLVAVFAFTLSFIVLLYKFWKDNTHLVPAFGGTYIEGSVGELQTINPWFSVTNDVNRDIVSLVFSGLLRYNPETQLIEDDLANLEVSSDNRIYTLTLKDDIHWHDSTKENPHLVTPEDVIFTFQTIQDPEFPNTLLRQNYLGVDMEKLDDRKIRFKLSESYSFFPSNLTLGILPKRSFEGIPISKLDQTLDFGFNPIGAGPYVFKSFIQTELSSEVTLERFERDIDKEEVFHLNQIIFRIFPDYTTLLSDIRNLDGVRHVPRNENGEPIIPRKFTATEYSLPQYVALFLNMERPILSDKLLRTGLQLGTNKQEIVDEISESLIVDTPLLEIDLADWRYKSDMQAAQGALFESDWHLPEKVRLQHLLEMRDANEVGALKIEPIVLMDTGAALTITGSIADAPIGSTLNSIPIVNHPTESGAWIISLPTLGNTGSIKLGTNSIKLQNSEGETIDSFYLWRTDKTKDFKRADEEQNLLERFIKTRDENLVGEQAVSFRDLYREKGMLRRRLSTDPYDIRVNEAGDKLSLTLMTSANPPQYEKIAKVIQKQWEPLGIHIAIVVPESRDKFEEKLLSRDYDILLFGQSLLDNLDSYPYWHSSGKQKLTGERSDLRLDAYNLSQYTSLEADTLLESIRQTSNESERSTSLEELREVLKNDVPAIFLYAPLYTFAYDKDVRGVALKNLSLHSDRFLTLHNWFIKQERVFKAGKNWWSFPGWMFGLL
ncbi:MAG: ABC transporter substrate-binding protein [Candidatus Peribacteraceae bacterium]|jgi:ABC-type transport system substrate-binding protein|nr:ABC transporter substrate-binding protein [Candidatus Peribacteraceae bacterium]HCI03691.1 hypothetical protein [Candidatus Peribacteria bacterium]